MAIVGGTPTQTGQQGGSTALGNLANLSAQQIGQALASGQLSIAQLQGALGTTAASYGEQAGAQQSSTALQEQSLGLSGANIGIQQQGARQQYALGNLQQGLEAQGYGLGQTMLGQQQAQNTAQFGYQQAGNVLTGQENTAQYGLAAQQYGTNVSNLQYQLGQSQLGAQSSAVAGGSLNTAGYANTQGNIAEQYSTNLAGLQNQFASTTSAYQAQQAQLGLTEQSQKSAYGYGQQQLSEQSQQAGISQASEVAGSQYSQQQIREQQKTLSNIAKANGVSEKQAESQLQSGLASLGLSDVMDTSGLLNEIVQANQGQASILEGAAGPLSLASGLGGFLGG